MGGVVDKIYRGMDTQMCDIKKNVNLIHVGHCFRFSILGVQNGVFISPATHSSHDAGRFDQKWLLFSFEIFALSST